MGPFIHLCIIWLLPITKAELSTCDRHHKAQKAKNIYYLALYRKSLLTPEDWLDQF